MESPHLTKTYPFLEEILNWYDKLDQLEDINDQINDILNLCDETRTFNSNLKTEERNTCKKILRKLFLCNGLNEPDSIMKCCIDLHFSLYIEMKKYSLSNGIIQEIFDLPVKSKNEQLKKDYCAPDMPIYGNLHKSDELIKLGIFIVNNDEFQNLLINNINYSKNCFFKSYFYECVNTYNVLNEEYCSEEKKGVADREATCGILRNFSDLYKSFVQMAKNKGCELPDLYYSQLYNVVSYTSESTNLESSSTASNNLYKPTPHIVPTAIGTMTAIPPFLALIYKFTPVGTWLRSKIKKRTNIFDNTDEQIENELFYPSNKNPIIYSSNASYNVSYRPV